MNQATFTCPRCFYSTAARADMRFCPHCGLSDPQEAARADPIHLKVSNHAYRIEDRVAIGSICNLYRCHFRDGLTQVEGILKLAREPQTNAMVANEAQVLRKLHSLDSDHRYAAFLPLVRESFAFADVPGAAPRQANILQMHSQIRRPMEKLYTLAEVRSAYPDGLDAKDIAWIWRRLLSILGFVHSHDVVHAAVLPMHVLIEPKDHKLVLIDWCDSVSDFTTNTRPAAMINGGYMQWYRQETSIRLPPKPALDIGFAARCMIDLLGGDAAAATMPPQVDVAIQRHLSRCVGDASRENLSAWKLLEDFDRLIEAMWGPRKFRPLAMPEK